MNMQGQITSALVCSGCGKPGKGSCACGLPYIPVQQRVTEYDKKNPGRSGRRVAADLGVSETTVRNARAGAQYCAPETITGRDGKKYPAKKKKKTKATPKRPTPEISNPVQEINSFHRELVGFLDGFTQRFNRWMDNGPLVDKDGKAALMQAFYLCADSFARFAQKLDGR